jgi:hypothetical protein
MKKEKLTKKQKELLFALHEEFGKESFSWSDYYNLVWKNRGELYDKLNNSRIDNSFWILTYKSAIKDHGGEIDNYTINLDYIPTEPLIIEHKDELTRTKLVDFI